MLKFNHLQVFNFWRVRGMEGFMHVYTFYSAGSDLLVVSAHTAVSGGILICRAPA